MLRGARLTSLINIPGPRVSLAFIETCTRRMPAGTPALPLQSCARFTICGASIRRGFSMATGTEISEPFRSTLSVTDF